MRLLLDTHVVLCDLLDARRVSPVVADAAMAVRPAAR
jgi:hypothetical protein